MGLFKNWRNRVIRWRNGQLVDVSRYYSPATKSGALSRIPKNFFQTWKTSRIDYGHAKQLIAFRKKNPTYHFHFFDDQRMDAWMFEHWNGEKIYEAYKSALYGASKADIWRTCILYKMGGVYLDFDSSILFDLDSIPNHVAEILSFEGNTVRSGIDPEHSPHFSYFQDRSFEQPKLEMPNLVVLNWLMIFEPRHPILEATIRAIESNLEFFQERVFASARLAVINFAGPMVLTKATWDCVERGLEFYQDGVDFRNKALFKTNSPHGSYATQPVHYAREIGKAICKRNPGDV